MSDFESEFNETGRFLPKFETSLENSELEGSYSYLPRRTPCKYCTPWVIHLLVFTVYTTIFFLLWDNARSPACSATKAHRFLPDTYSPAREALKWEARMFENQLEVSNPFKGPPRPELEEAWHKLLNPAAAVRVEKEVLDRINRTSVALQDGSGYMVGLDVYHQLHCLRYVRRYLHREHYNMTEENLGQHIDHCLDGLRQYVMCNADVVLNTFDWIPNFPRPWPNFQVTHECVNWEAIEEWTSAHSFNGFDPELIKHPDFHPELPSPFNYTVSGNEP